MNAANRALSGFVYCNNSQLNSIKNIHNKSVEIKDLEIKEFKIKELETGQ